MADGEVALEGGQRAVVEGAGDEALVLDDGELDAVGHRHAGGLLAPVLQGVQGQVGRGARRAGPAPPPPRRRTPGPSAMRRHPAGAMPRPASAATCRARRACRWPASWRAVVAPAAGAVTGATGFLGSHLTGHARRPRRRRRRARGVTTCRPSSLRDAWRDQVTSSTGDVEDQAARRADARRVRGAHRLPPGGADARSAWPTATRRRRSRRTSPGTWRVLEAARRSPLVEQVVTASSDKAYGDAARRCPTTRTCRCSPRNPYDVSKACADLIATSYHRTFGVPVCVTRCGNFFGPGDLNWERLVPGTIRSLAARASGPIIRSDGTLVRDYLYVVDGALAYLAARRGDGRPTRRWRGEAFNFSTETPLSVLELVALLQTAAGTDLEPDVRGTPRHEIDRAVPLGGEGAAGCSAGSRSASVGRGARRHRGLVPRLPRPAVRLTADRRHRRRRLRRRPAGRHLVDAGRASVPSCGAVDVAAWLGAPASALDLARAVDARRAALDGAARGRAPGRAQRGGRRRRPGRRRSPRPSPSRRGVAAPPAAGRRRRASSTSRRCTSTARRSRRARARPRTLAPAARSAVRRRPAGRASTCWPTAASTSSSCSGSSNAVGRAGCADAVDRWTLVANDLCRQAVTTGALALRTTGTQWRDFVALDDVVPRSSPHAVDGESVAGHLQPRVRDRRHRVRDARRDGGRRCRAADGRAPAAATSADARAGHRRAPYTVDVGRLARHGRRASTSRPGRRSTRRYGSASSTGTDRTGPVSEIDGVRVTPLRRIPDERGAVLHMLRADAEDFERLRRDLLLDGVSRVRSRRWHLHQEMTLNYAVPVGMVKLVCYDDRDGSPTTGEPRRAPRRRARLLLVTVPPIVWNGFKGEGTGPALVANCATDPAPTPTRSSASTRSRHIPYDWRRCGGTDGCSARCGAARRSSCAAGAAPGSARSTRCSPSRCSPSAGGRSSGTS